LANAGENRRVVRRGRERNLRERLHTEGAEIGGAEKRNPRAQTGVSVLQNSEKRRSAELLGGVEEVVGGVGGAKFLAGVGGVATGGGGFAAFGVKALDGGGAGEDAGAVVGEDGDEEPGDGIGVGRGSVGDGFTGDAAAIVGLPGGAGKVFAEGFAVLVEELGVWSLESPCELSAIGFAGVDLVALGVELEEELFVGGRLELRRHFLRRSGQGKKGGRDGEQVDGCEYANGLAHGKIPPVTAEAEVAVNLGARLPVEARGILSFEQFVLKA
jgi:hypothetical protein